MKITCIDSGSQGNCFYAESDKGTGVFLDAGCPYKQICSHDIKVAGKPFFVTHEHGDHSKYAHELERKYGAKIYSTHGTAEALDCGTGLGDYFYIFVGGLDIDVQTIPVVHNAIDPCCYYIEIDGESILYITDTGTIPEVRHLRPDVLIVEANYTKEKMSTNAMRSESAQIAYERITSNAGHLSAEQAAAIAEPMLSSLDLLILCHMSKRNFDIVEYYQSDISEEVKKVTQFAYAGAKWNTIPF